ncbi:hypothetical protein H9M94_01275 [Mycoplasma sp. Pen4]|uniref:hypothetical protein n=1 Tax=Mycoplasma sp. Pen4 TaxID=640330 RepID=UPI0016542345|nr:hypothetical protein [Mycoplasma sp. Pen4]QNM93889.1 hypothetical protein H9M94_01275 [Mycoplasma sp. Pen4]
MNNKAVDLEKVKLLAESYLHHKKESQELLKMIKEEFADTTVSVSEALSEGGKLSYTQVAPKPRMDFKGYSAYLQTAVVKNISYTEDELVQIMEEFIVQKEPKWVLKITK